MTESQPETRSHLQMFGNHLLEMPRWHRWVLILGVLLAGGGLIGRMTHPTPPTPPSAANSPANPVNPSTAARGDTNANGSSARNSPPSGVTSPVANVPPQSQTGATPWMSRIGISLIGGFVIGWVFRTFVKTMALVTAAGAMILGGLSYFHVMNVDLTAAEKRYDTAAAWINDQAYRLKDVAMAYIPVHCSGLAGAYIGFRRK